MESPWKWKIFSFLVNFSCFERNLHLRPIITEHSLPKFLFVIQHSRTIIKDDFTHCTSHKQESIWHMNEKKAYFPSNYYLDEMMWMWRFQTIRTYEHINKISAIFQSTSNEHFLRKLFKVTELIQLQFNFLLSVCVSFDTCLIR